MSDDFDPSNLTPGAPTGGLPAFAAKLPLGAQNFIKSYSPADDDVGVIASFETIDVFQTFKSKQASERENRPIEIFEPVTFIRINVRGNDKIEVHRPVTDADKRRFPYAWQQYEQGRNHSDLGTPLSAIGMDAPTVRQMQAKNVYTIEDLALVNDIHLQNLGAGAREWRHKAKQFVDARAPKAANTDQVEALSAQLSEALEMMKAQQAEIEALKARRGPGRPPKEPEAA